jgi:hypothetical protein
MDPSHSPQIMEEACGARAIVEIGSDGPPHAELLRPDFDRTVRQTAQLRGATLLDAGAWSF